MKGRTFSHPLHAIAGQSGQSLGANFTYFTLKEATQNIGFLQVPHAEMKVTALLIS